MALVSLSDAAKLVRKARTTLVRDIENGRLNKTVLQDGDVRIDTAELLRAYGRLHSPQAASPPREIRKSSADKTKIALLEERIRSLERVIALEAELRRVKDQVTTELRARLVDKDHMIKILESKIIFLEYDKQIQQARPVPTLEPEVPAPARSAPSNARAAPAATSAQATSAAASASMPPQSSARNGNAEGAPKAKYATPAAPASPIQATATSPAPSTVQTPPPSARSAPGAPGGLERRHAATTRGWWQRLFGRRERQNR
jgi:hypothetical protein